MRYRPILAIAAPLSLLLALTGCGSDTDANTNSSQEAQVADGPLKQLITDAKSEGEVVVYAHQDETVLQAVAEGFQKKYGISVEYSRMVSGDIIQRYSAEADAGSIVADVTMQTSSAFVRDAIKKGWMMPLRDADIPGFPQDWPEKFVLNDDGSAIVGLAPFGIAYNTDLVSKEDAPKTWEDLLDPKWKGEILLSDPTSGPSYAGLFDALLQKYGPDLLTGIGDSVLRTNASMVPNLEALGAGEAALGVPSLPTLVDTAKKSGAPIEFVRMEFATGTDSAVGFTAHGPHFNAARLFVHYVLSEEGQRLLNGQPGAASPLTEVGLPAEYQRPRPESLNPARQAEMWDLMGLKSLT